MALRTRGIRKQIYQALTQAIADGTHPPGSKLPTVRELGRAYGTSHANAAVVVQQLADEGHLVKRQGSGVYVSHVPRREPNSLRVHNIHPVGPELSAAINQFQERNRHISIYTDATKQAADVIFFGAFGMRRAARDGEIRCVDDLLAQHGVERDVFHPQALLSALDEDRLYALPVVFSPDILFYNPKLVTIPFAEIANWTLDEFQDFVAENAATYAKLGAHAYDARYSYLGQVRPFLAAFGAAEVDTTARCCLMDQPPALEAFTYVRDLVARASVDRHSAEYHDMLPGRCSVALATMPGMLNPELRTASTGAMRPAPFPIGRAPHQNVMGMWVAVSTDCADPELAWRFVQHLTSPETQRAIAEAHCLFPARRDALAVLQALDEACYAPVIERLDATNCVTPALHREDFFYLNQILEDWRVTRELPALLARACEKFNHRLRRPAGLDPREFIGI